MRGNSLTPPMLICFAISSSVMCLICLWSCSRLSCCLLIPISLAVLSFSTTTKVSPACGVPSKPNTCTGVEGGASRTLFPLSSNIARTLPWYIPATNGSPILKVPFWTRIVAVIPLPLSSWASTTAPRASLSGFAFKSSNSASSNIFSNNCSTLVPCFADN